MNTLAVVVAVGARTAVGLTARHTAFLLRAGVAGFHETPLLDANDETVTVASVPVLDPKMVGVDRVRLLAFAALDEVLDTLGDVGELRVRIVLGVDEALGRRLPPAMSQADEMASALQAHATKRGVVRIAVEVVARSEASAGLRVTAACNELAANGVDVVLLGGSHSDYDPEIVRRLSSLGRLFGPGNINGIIPGESAAFIALANPALARKRDWLVRARLHAVGLGIEKANPDNDHPASEALGLTQAVRMATGSLEADKLRIGWMLTDMTAEFHRVLEWQAVLVRTQNVFGDPQWIDAHAHRLGRLGASALPLQIAIAATAWHHGFAPHGLALSMVGSDAGDRVATLWGAPESGKGVQSPLGAPPAG
jgi:3-oxoacyl-[acyl-carrier-protein] synthase-1